MATLSKTKPKSHTRNTLDTSEVSNGYFISIHKEGQAIILNLMSGKTIEGTYLNADKFTLLVKDDTTGRNRLIYKHAIESIEKGINDN